MNAVLTALFDRLRATGFTPAQAQAYWDEIHVLASPILFSLSALRASPAMRATAMAHGLLAKTVLEIKTPGQWVDYCADMPLHLHQVQEAVSERWEGCQGALRDYWPVLAMDEGVKEYQQRATIGHEMPSQCANTAHWEDLLDRVEHRYALDVLCEQVSVPEVRNRRSWQRVLNMTGIRSLRWSFGDDPGDAAHQSELMEVLLHAQRLLRAGVQWNGPVLGLAGHTSIALTDRGKSDGMVQPDPGGQGQTMTLGHWSVLAHEWMHTLDIGLARHFNCSHAWATHAALAWQEEDAPPEHLMVWFWQMGRVLGTAPPEHLLVAIRQDLDHWQSRLRMSLGQSLSVQEEIARQEVRMSRGTWTREDSEDGWKRVLMEQGDVAQSRTAHLLSRDMEFVLRARSGEVSGYWSEYISSLRSIALQSPSVTQEGLAIPLAEVHASSLRYLTNSVEIMARSFEASLANDRAPDAVWLPSSLRPNAGLLWPSAAEAAFHGIGWRSTLKALRPVWREWKAKFRGGEKLHPQVADPGMEIPPASD